MTHYLSRLWIDSGVKAPFTHYSCWAALVLHCANEMDMHPFFNRQMHPQKQRPIQVQNRRRYKYPPLWCTERLYSFIETKTLFICVVTTWLVLDPHRRYLTPSHPSRISFNTTRIYPSCFKYQNGLAFLVHLHNLVSYHWKVKKTCKITVEMIIDWKGEVCSLCAINVQISSRGLVAIRYLSLLVTTARDEVETHGRKDRWR